MEDRAHQHIEIIKAVQQGDAKAEYQLYVLYSKAMFNTALRVVNNRQDAEDVLQDAFVAAFKGITSYRFDSSFGSWLKRIVINKSINHIQKRKIEFANEEVEKLQVEAEEDVGVSETSYSVEKVRQAMKELPDGYRVILSLYLFEGYDHVEISHVLKISCSTSKSQYHRAKKKLRTILLTEL